MSGKSQKPFVATGQARSTEQARVLEEIVEREECPFCPENLSKTHKLPIIVDGRGWILTENQWPYDHTRVHLLMILKRHARSITELTPDESAEIIELASFAVERYDLQSSAIVIRFGEIGYNGSSVDHLHVHIIEGDHHNPSAEKVKVKVSDPTYKP